MDTREDYGPQGCAKQGAKALWALALIAGLLGVLRRFDRRGGKR
jgi:hypothetical protein